MKDYFKIKRCSNSELTQIKRELIGLPPLIASQQTLHFGKMMHTRLFEPNKYLPLVTTLSMTERLMVDVMMKECMKSSMIKSFINNPQTVFEEVHLFEFESVKFKMRLDSRLFKWIGDLKTTSKPTKEEFISSFDAYGYWRQAALYMHGSGATQFTFWGITKSHTKPQLWIVNTKDYPEKMEEAIEEAKLLTLHYQHKKAA